VNRSTWGLGSGPDVDWLARAKCRGHDPEWWSVVDGSTPKLTVANLTAIQVCNACPVLAECGSRTDPDLHAGTIRAGRVVKRSEWARCARCHGPFKRSKTRGNTQRYCSDDCRPVPLNRDKAGTRVLMPCGTNAAWTRHYLAREEPDPACVAARAAHLEAYRRRRRKG
jgi:hypothetical protein